MKRIENTVRNVVNNIGIEVRLEFWNRAGYNIYRKAYDKIYDKNIDNFLKFGK